MSTKYQQSHDIVQIPVELGFIEADLCIPENATGIVIFAHGSGSSRLSTRNKRVAKDLNDHGIATLLLDLLTIEEELDDRDTGVYRFNVSILAERLQRACQWVKINPQTKNLKFSIFGASTGAAAAIIVAANNNAVKAVVSRGGRVDLAEEYLNKVRSPVLLIVGELDDVVLQLNQEAFNKLTGEKSISIIPGASHLFEEEGKLELVSMIAREWFQKYFNK